MRKSNIPYTTKEFIKLAKKVYGEKYIYDKVNYINSRTKIIIVCPEHGDFQQTPYSHLRNHNCPKCASKKHNYIKYSQIKFIEKAKSVHSNKYDHSKVNYKNNKTKVIIICPEHGEFKQRPDSHLCDKRGCPICAKNFNNNKLRTTIDQFIIKAKLVHNNKYNYDKARYNGSFSKITIICPKHGEFIQYANHHISGCGCPVCDESKGEKLIRQYLKENNVIFVQEKSFGDLRGINGGLLRFDFFLPDFNICIEFDGRQHFDKKYCNKYYGIEKSNYYNILKIHDHKKSKYCRKQGIKLIRIPYYCSNKIKSILNVYSSINKAA
jgi:very-short-patch-repair endonuclease/Zn finger protein HypA/HybF involved in hydrogenase expression